DQTSSKFLWQSTSMILTIRYGQMMGIKLGRTGLRCGIAAICLVLSACSEPHSVSGEDLPPEASARNLLLICIDTVRADVFYALGKSRRDALSAWEDRALLFEQATSSSSWTVPAIGSALSGLWQSGHGAGQVPSGVIAAGPASRTALYEDVTVLTEVAAQEGFHTAVISASPWTNNADDPLGLSRGFSRVMKIRANDSGLGFAKIKEALAQNHEDAPFFHFLHLMEAHRWHMGREPELDARIAKFSTEERALFLEVAPPQACEDEQSLLCKRFLAYAAAVSSLRQSIAGLLSQMKGENLLDDTAVILFSDHGEEFGEHYNDTRIRRVLKGFPHKYIGHGQSMYQELLHVPLVVWHPNYEGTKINELVSLVDIGPTAARWLGLDFLPEQWPGFYLDQYLEPSQKALDRVAYASGIVVGEPQLSALQGTKKSIWYMKSDEYSYFDLVSDPFEMHPEPTDSLVMRFDSFFIDYAQSERIVEREAAKISDKHLERLQAIGYLQGSEN
ncbi:MAG: sulfatase, partial [bacterium]